MRSENDRIDGVIGMVRVSKLREVRCCQFHLHILRDILQFLYTKGERLEFKLDHALSLTSVVLAPKQIRSFIDNTGDLGCINLRYP